MRSASTSKIWFSDTTAIAPRLVTQQTLMVATGSQPTNTLYVPAGRGDRYTGESAAAHGTTSGYIEKNRRREKLQLGPKNK